MAMPASIAIPACSAISLPGSLLAAILATGLHEQRPVGRLLGHPHTALIGIGLGQHGLDLLGGPVRLKQLGDH